MALRFGGALIFEAANEIIESNGNIGELCSVSLMRFICDEFSFLGPIKPALALEDAASGVIQDSP